MNTIFSFGEKIPEYEMKVLNEREVRASAGILFLFAIISFLNSWLIGNFIFTKAFVVLFLVDFSIRVLINPKYAPTLIIARFFVRHQKVEYVGAPQKRFAWLIGLVLAIVMFYLIVLNNLIGPFNLLVCLICLTLLFFEAAFGICLGCKIYNLFHKEKAQLCPGNVCEVNERESIQVISPVQIALVFLFFGLTYTVANSALINESAQVGQSQLTGINKDCEIPAWVKKIGHEEKWKLHNGCRSSTKKPEPQHLKTSQIQTPDALKPSANKMMLAPAAQQVKQAVPDVKKDCLVPDWAIKKGHAEMWKKHNGCADTTPSNAAEVIPVPTQEVKQAPSTAKHDCIVPDWAVKMGHAEMWKQHNCK